MEVGMQQKNSLKLKQNITVIVFLVVVGLVVLNSLLFYTRIDLTENKAYSISKISQEIVQSIPDTVYVDYYISPKLKTATPDAQHMIDILQEYQSRSNGHVVFTEKDPDKPQNIGQAEEKGLTPQQIQVLEKNQATYAVVYSGLVISYQSETRTIPFFLQPAVLEYQVTSKIQEMITNDNRVAGILVLDDAYQDQRSLQGLRQTLGSDYTVQDIEKGTRIDESVDVLFVIGAKDIDNDTAYYVDQFLMQGKGAYFAADRVRIDINRGLFGVYQNSLLHDMLKNYGITIEDTIVLDEYNKLIPVNQGQGLQILQNYPMWITALPENVDKAHPITARFAGLDLFWTSPLRISDDIKDFVTTLVSSSDKSWSKGYAKDPNEQKSSSDSAPKVYQLQPNQTQFLLDKTEDNTKPYAVTSSFLGPLTSAVEKNILTIPDGEKDTYRDTAASARFVVTGSAFFASYLYQVTNAAYNLSFLSNASDWLGSDEKLLQIKSRIIKDVRLNKIQDAGKKNTLAFLAQLWNMVFLPLIIVGIAIIVLAFRRSISSKKYHSET